MGLKEVLQRVLSEYPTASTQKFSGHELAHFLRRDFPQKVREIIFGFSDADGADYIVQGSPGQGQWGRCPWVAIFQPDVTESAERGFYPVYLYREDFSGLYLSLNQGVTDMREQYQAGVKAALRSRASDYRTRLGEDIPPFTSEEIDLTPSGPANYSALYEAGNIVAKFYPADSIPDEVLLIEDLRAVLKLYEALEYSVSQGGSALEPEEQDNDFIEDYAAFKRHRRIERNAALVKRVKEIHGFTCAACGFNFAKRFPGIKKNQYIEAHHLVPVAQLRGNKISRNAETDFIVLCANCHRMIHRHPEPWDLAGFRKALGT